MILLGLVSMGIFIGMPKLVENSKPVSASRYTLPCSIRVDARDMHFKLAFLKPA